MPSNEGRRAVAWSLIRELAGADVEITNTCPRCGEPHGPVAVAGADVHASIAYAGGYALAAVIEATPGACLGIDAEAVADARRDAAGLDGVLGTGRSVTLRDWVRVEAALKADGRGLRVDPATVTVHGGDGAWEASVPGRARRVQGADLVGPPGVLVSAAIAPPETAPGAAAAARDHAASDGRSRRDRLR
ncbi:MAG: chemotaxis protein CheY [Actinobacteria bacterium]|nr:chemotaxis protein CheY [Actinomycetota bacterium]